MMIGPAPMMRMVEISVRFGIRSSSRPRPGRAGATFQNERTKKGRRALGRDASFVAAPDRPGRSPASEWATLSIDDYRWRGKGRKPRGPPRAGLSRSRRRPKQRENGKVAFLS